MAVDADCIIVGGGIGGAVLALALAQAGRRAIILERSATPPPSAFARPEILAGATVETFTRLSIGERITREAAVPLDGLELYEAGGRDILFRVTQDDIRASRARPYSTDPAATRRIVLEEAARTGRVAIERGVEVQGLLRHGQTVVGVRAVKSGASCEYRAPLTVGDDGTHSRLRDALHIPVTLRNFAFDFLGAVIPRAPEQPDRVGQAWLNVAGMRRGLFAGLRLPIPGNRTALVFGVTPAILARLRRRPDTFHPHAAHLSPVFAAAALPEFPEGYGHFSRPFGHAARYVGDGVALLGDAAHPVTPAGGQGANMSVADAIVLARVAMEGLRTGDCSVRRLAAYENERRPANARSLLFSRRPTTVFRFLQAVPFAGPLLLSFIRRANRRPDTKRRFVGGVARAFLSSTGAGLGPAGSP